MAPEVTTLDENRPLQPLDAAFLYGGIAIRALGYASVAIVASRYSFGEALLTGLFAGDLIGRMASTTMRWRDDALVQSCEFLFLGLVWLLAHSLFVWPTDSAMRAVVTLAAFGSIMGHVSGWLLDRLGPAPA